MISSIGSARLASTLAKKNRVVIGGGNGFVGKELRRTLERKGYEVLVVSRSSSGDLNWEGIRSGGLPSGTKAVVNLAGQNILDPLKRWNESFKKIVYDSRIDTAKTLLDAIGKSEDKPDVFVQITGVGYYSPDVKTIQTEESPGGDHDFLATLVRDLEDVSATTDIRNVCLRSGVVLGRKGGMISQIFLSFYCGLGGVMGSGEQPFPWIHVDDLSRAFLHVIENPKVSGPVNAVSPSVSYNKEFVRAFAGALNRPAFFPVPEFVWNTAFGPERANMIIKGPKVEPKKLNLSGFQFQYPTLQEACGEFSKLFY